MGLSLNLLHVFFFKTVPLFSHTAADFETLFKILLLKLIENIDSTDESDQITNVVKKYTNGIYNFDIDENNQ